MTSKHVATTAYFLGAFMASSLTFLFGAIPMFYFAERVTPIVYWASVTSMAGISAALGWSSPAVLFVGIATLVFGFQSLHKRYSFFVAAGVSVLSATLTILGAGLIWVRKYPEGLRQVQNLMTQALSKMSPDLTSVQIQELLKNLTLQIPSIVVISLAIALWLSFIGYSGWKKSSEHKLEDNPLYDFHVPDAGIWVFILALAGSYMNGLPDSVQIVATNVLNIAVLTYFFQGLSVVLTYFRRSRMDMVWRTILIVLLTTQMFLFVSVLGLVDYWLQFRVRLNKKKENQPDNEWMGS